MILWEIYHPTEWYGKVSSGHEVLWDDYVLEIASGLTWYPSVTGIWGKPDVALTERMTPVRIACSRKQIEQIMAFTASHYKQQAVFAYRVSDEVLLNYYNVGESNNV